MRKNDRAALYVVVVKRGVGAGSCYIADHGPADQLAWYAERGSISIYRRNDTAVIGVMTVRDAAVQYPGAYRVWRARWRTTLGI